MQSVFPLSHVIANLPFLTRIICRRWLHAGNSACIISDDWRRLKYTAWYWHFIDIVWFTDIVFL
jgi:heme/copper-type cytochrome/quinol oxidase subunit 3